MENLHIAYICVHVLFFSMNVHVTVEIWNKIICVHTWDTMCMLENVFDLRGSEKWLQTIYCVLWSCSQTVGTGKVQYPPNVQQTNDPLIYPWSNQALDSRDGQEIRTTAVKTRQQASHGSQVCICLYNYSTTLDSTADFCRLWIKKWETLRNHNYHTHRIHVCYIW